MPKNQSTAAKKARAAQRADGGKHTALLAEQTQQSITLPLDDHLRAALTYRCDQCHVTDAMVVTFG